MIVQSLLSGAAFQKPNKLSAQVEDLGVKLGKDYENESDFSFRIEAI
jgi:hypothetical protein